MQNIVVLTDFSYLSFNALELAKKIAEKMDGTIHLVHVIEAHSDHYVSIGEPIEDNLSAAYTNLILEKTKTELERIKQAHASRFYDIKTTVLTGDPYQETKQFIEYVNPDLMVLGAKGQSDAKELFLGSFSDKIVRSIPCPVVTVKDNVEENQFINIVYATDLKEEHKELIRLLKKFQALFESSLHLVKINTPKNFSNDIDTLGS